MFHRIRYRLTRLPMPLLPSLLSRRLHPLWEMDLCECIPLLRTFMILEFVLQVSKNNIFKYCHNYFRHLCLKFFIFHMSERWFPWHSKKCIPPINPEMLFSDILATAKVKCMDLKLCMHNNLVTLEYLINKLEQIFRHMRLSWHNTDKNKYSTYSQEWP